LIYNTMTFSVVSRRGLIATLRTLGVTRAQIFRTVAGEALWLGILGTVLGLVLGAQLARGLLVLVSQTMNDLYFVVSVRAVHLDGGILAQAALLGVGATFLGALFPAIEATRAQPRIALTSSSLESRWRALLSRFAIVGALSLAVAIALFSWTKASLSLSLLGLLFLLAAAGLFTPALTVGCARLAAPILGYFAGLFGRHAARGVERQLSRTSVAIAALAVAISAGVGMGVMVDSFRSTFVKWLGLTLEADVYASAPTLMNSHNTSALDPRWVETLRAVDGVREITTYRGFETHGVGGTVLGAAITLNAQRESSFDFLDAQAELVWPAFGREDALIISESFGFRHSLGSGDRLELATDRGMRSFAILGTYADFASDQGTVLMSRATYERSFKDRGVTSLGIFAQAGVDFEDLVARLRARVPADQSINIRSNRTLKESSMAVFERTFAITGVLRLLATLVAFVGVLSALLALEMERAREIGVLRAQGVTPREVRKLVFCETGLIGAIAGLIAMPLGLALALVLIRVINKRAFGWSLDLRLDPWIFGSALLLAIGAALLAGIWPAWRMSRARPALALRAD
jgi:putative ABC transport system permease protein